MYRVTHFLLWRLAVVASARTLLNYKWSESNTRYAALHSRSDSTLDYTAVCREATTIAKPGIYTRGIYTLSPTSECRLLDTTHHIKAGERHTATHGP